MRLDTKQAKRTLRAPARYGLILLAVAICAAGATADHLRPAQAGPAPKAAAIAHAKTPGGVDKDAFGSPEPQRATTGPGYTFLQANLNAQTPAGFQVWVSPRAAHHSTIVKNAAAAVRDLRRLGVKIRWRGSGAPPDGEGVIVLREGRKGCGSTTSVIGMTWTYSHALPSGERYASGAGVWLCPRLFDMGAWATAATIRHELGHAIGLGHTNYRYDGSYQIMNATLQGGVRAYGAGDQAGLRRLVANTRRIKSQIPPLGNLDGSSYQSDGTIKFHGWALLQYYPSAAVTVTLTDNGTVIYRGNTPVERKDINRRYDPGTDTHGYRFTIPWTGGSHNFCVIAQATDHPDATTQLGCVTWHD